MRKLSLIFTSIVILFVSELNYSQAIRGKDFGFGIILGEPTGLTAKFWTNSTNAFVFDLGKSYFGSPRIGADYIWHFNAFNSNTANLYAGPGVALGIGEGNGFWYRDSDRFLHRDEAGLGIRGIFGVNILPERTPLEFFFEAGVLIGLAPGFGSAIDAALGMRFYP